MIEQARNWWRSLRPTQRRRMLLIMIVPALGLAITGYQLVDTIFNEEEVRPYDITPSAALAPTVEPNLFEVDFALQPLITDDIFFGLHKQIQDDLPILQTLDADKAAQKGPGIAVEIENVRELLGDPSQLGVRSYKINVRKTGTQSGEVGLSMVYELPTGQRVSVQYSLVYEIKVDESVSASTDPVYSFDLVELDSDGRREDAGDSLDDGQEVEG